LKLNRILQEIFQDASRYWIDSKGKVIDISRKFLHSEYTKNIFKDSEDPIKEAMNNGWIRVTTESGMVWINYDKNNVSRLAIKSLYEEIEQSYDIFMIALDDENSYKELSIDDFLKRFKRFR